ncbi:biotin--[acetyl-CoA-carboxylase] ligase [Kytococcus sedentarius]|uniref:biotin--[acetyl-CoA-carboxylase] ligase n=1 Tax=Kytococcus sedentarius TaxID=1276 RepID=UPI0035BC6E60
MSHLSSADHSPAPASLEDHHSGPLDVAAVRRALLARAAARRAPGDPHAGTKDHHGADAGASLDAVGAALVALAEGFDHHAQLPSTQPLAAASGRAWHVVSTDHQIAGRGRLGRSWESPAAAGIALSVVLPLEDGSDAVGAALAASRTPQWGQVPLCVGAAVHDALGALGVPTGVKWPNDVLSRSTGRKLAGILCQVGDQGRSIVAGIGLNVWDAADRVAGIASRYGSVQAEAPSTGPDLRERVVVEVLHALAVWHCAWLAEGSAPAGADGGDSLTDRLAAVSLTVGQEVDLHLPDGTVQRGDAVGLAESGAVLVRVPTGEGGRGAGTEVREFRAADVVHLRPAGGSP